MTASPALRYASAVRILVLVGLWWLALLAGPALAAPALWSVKGPAGEATILGTIHAMPPGLKWLTPGLARRLDAADTLVLEAILPDDPAALGPIMARYGLLAAPRPILGRVPVSARPALAKALAATGMPPAALDKMKSWLVSILLTQAVLKEAGLDANSGTENQLRKRLAGRVKLAELESAEAQFAMLDGLSQADQDKMLAEAVEDSKAINRQLRAILKAWRAGNVEVLARDFAGEGSISPGARRLLLTDRNARWADWIKTRLAKPGRLVIAVGAAHLGGKDGLIEGLRARGMKPRRIQ